MELRRGIEGAEAEDATVEESQGGDGPESRVSKFHDY